MRQMDTILVAVGVPTKEVPGASFVLPQSVKAAEKTVDHLERTSKEQPMSVTQNPGEKDKTCSQESRDWREVTETEDLGDGWDIPDITDLLDALNETESHSQASIPNHASPNKEEETTDDTSSLDVNARTNGLEEADPNDEHVSWSWDDTHWTTDRSHK